MTRRAFPSEVPARKPTRITSGSAFFELIEEVGEVGQLEQRYDFEGRACGKNLEVYRR